MELAQDLPNPGRPAVRGLESLANLSELQMPILGSAPRHAGFSFFAVIPWGRSHTVEVTLLFRGVQLFGH
ncbi:MAG: hypothetical protein GY835_03535 [bacterium]|nr:hypothetical protein [bacterium]